MGAASRFIAWFTAPTTVATDRAEEARAFGTTSPGVTVTTATKDEAKAIPSFRSAVTVATAVEVQANGEASWLVANAPATGAAANGLVNDTALVAVAADCWVADRPYNEFDNALVPVANAIGAEDSSLDTPKLLVLTLATAMAELAIPTAWFTAPVKIATAAVADARVLLVSAPWSRSAEAVAVACGAAVRV
jgi:hypothetical protein